MQKLYLLKKMRIFKYVFFNIINKFKNNNKWKYILYIRIIDKISWNNLLNYYFKKIY